MKVTFHDCINIVEIYENRVNKGESVDLRDVITDYFGISYREYYQLLKDNEVKL